MRLFEPCNAMKNWSAQDAKVRFSELLETCLQEGPQLITCSGVSVAVLVPISEWRRLSAPRPSLKELLLTVVGRGELNIPPRGGLRRRRPITGAGTG
jgi:antitoxin Phd